LGKFQLLELLGQGSFGMVFKARDVELDRLVAVKVPRAGGPREKDLRGFEWYYWQNRFRVGLLVLQEDNPADHGLQLSSDGKRLAAVTHDGTIKSWNAITGQEFPDLRTESSQLDVAAFSPDGKRLATRSRAQEPTIQLWNAKTGELTRTLTGHVGRVNCVAFDPECRRLASGGDDRIVRLWDVADGRQIMALERQSGSISFVTFSPDGKRLAFAVFLVDDKNRTQGGEIRVWDLESGHESLYLKGHTSGINSIAFRPDGRRLASARHGSVNPNLGLEQRQGAANPEGPQQ
jgi:WD40 repeat protein